MPRMLMAAFAGLVFLHLSLDFVWCRARGERVETPSIADLLDRSEVVLIGAVIKSAPTGRSVKDVDISFSEVKTVFAVRAVLKGKATVKEVAVLHYRPEAGQETLARLRVASFQTVEERRKQSEGEIKKPKPTERAVHWDGAYTLFLKKKNDAEYVLLTGMRDSALSARRLECSEE